MLKLNYANLFSLGFFIILVVGIPVFLAGYLLTENKFYSRAPLLILTGILFGHFLKTSLYSRSVQIDKSVVLYFSFFSLLGFTTLIAQPPWEGYDNTQNNQILGLFGAFIWSSLFFSISSYVINVSNINLIFKLLRYCGVLISLSVCVSLFGINFGEVLVFNKGEYIRYFGPMGDQVGFVIVLFSSIALLHHRWPELILHVSAILLTGTRGAFLSFLISVFLFIFLFSDKKRFRKLLIVFFLLIATSFFITQTDLGESYLSRFSGEKMESSSYTRQTAMLYGIFLFIENPLLGVGFSGYNTQVWALNPARHLGNFTVELQENYLATTANQYIQTATDGGIFALMLLIMLFYNMLRIVFKVANNTNNPEVNLTFRASFIWMLSIIIGNQAAVWLLPNSLINYYFFMLGGLALASLHLLRNAKNA